MKKCITLEQFLELSKEDTKRIFENCNPNMIGTNGLELFTIGDMMELLDKNMSVFKIEKHNHYGEYTCTQIYTGNVEKPTFCSFESEICNALWDCIKWCLKEGLI